MAEEMRRADAAPFTVCLLRNTGPEWDRCERDLLLAGLPLHVFHRAAWARERQSGRSWLLAVMDQNCRCRGAVTLVAHRSRALPGQLLLRAERCGSALPAETVGAAAAALRALARSPRVLRMQVELFAADVSERAPLGLELSARGFRRAPETHHYQTTLRVDLTRDASTILASFSRVVRRHIRALDESPFELRPIVDERYVARLDALVLEAMQRTGGQNVRYEHAAMARLTRTAPDLSRLLGIFHRGSDAPESIVAYAWGGLHGDYCGYDAGAATRIPGVNVGFTPPLLWDLMCWSKARGARWFDMGGVSEGGLASADPVGGISDFKRYFSKDVAQVAEDWVLEPHPSSAALARVLTSGAQWLARTCG
jgi:hypothetical protein